MDALGGLPPVKIHCSVLAEEALKAAIEDYEAKTKTGPLSKGRCLKKTSGSLPRLWREALVRSCA